MKQFKPITFSPRACRDELAEFRAQLDSHRELSESQDVLPFFKKRLALSAFVGTVNRSVNTMDRIAFEFGLWGDFSCDLIVGDSARRAYTLVEFEDGKKNSVFRKGSRATSDWSYRFEHGFSQIVDWIWKLDEHRMTPGFRERFGGDEVTFSGLLVVGRSEFLTAEDRRPLEWRARKVSVNGYAISCLTFDDLYLELNDRFDTLQRMAAEPD